MPFGIMSEFSGSNFRLRWQRGRYGVIPEPYSWRVTQRLPYSEELERRAWRNPEETFIGLQDAGIIKPNALKPSVLTLIEFEVYEIDFASSYPERKVLLAHFFEQIVG